MLTKWPAVKKANSRNNVFPLWAGLLIAGSLAPLFAGANERTDELLVRVDDGLVSVTARNVPIRAVLQEIATQCDLRFVQHVALDRVVTLIIDRQPLPDVLDQILSEESYQLFQAGVGGPIPGALWIFSEGPSSAPATTIFFEVVLFHGNLREKKEAIRELRRLGTPDAVQTLSLALTDEDSRVRDAAFEALSKVGGEEALAAIASASLDSDPWVRSEAANALSSANTESAVAYLQLAFQDPDPRVRMSVIEALSDIPSEQAIAALSLALQDEDAFVRMHAVEAMEEIGGEIEFQALMRAQFP